MDRIAIISIDGHVKASRAQYRDSIEKKHLEVYDEQVKEAEEAGLRDAGNLHMEFDPAVQWDSDLRTENLESKGVVARCCFLTDGRSRWTASIISPKRRART
jgi:hypothetical protein